MSTTPPGWYPDPADAGSLRYFDGDHWTERTMAAPAPQASALVRVPDAPAPEGESPDQGGAGHRRSRRQRNGWLLWAAVAGVIVIGSVVVGVAMLTRGESTPAAATEAPDLVSMSVTEAQAALAAAGLTGAYRAGAPDEDHLDQWIVTSQDPVAGAALDGTEVLLWTGTPLSIAVDDCGVNAATGDGGTSVLLDMKGSDAGSGELSQGDVACVLAALGIPDSVVSEMDQTRALDGRQQASWDGVDASWSYHPDNGLDVILELAE